MHFKPAFRLGIFCTERSGLEDKIGGLPFGFPPDRWPTCAVCGTHQNYIAQFRHSEKIDLGAAGRTLFLFQCPHGDICGAWDHLTGANAALLVDGLALTSMSTTPPRGTVTQPEGIITRWEPVSGDLGISCVGPHPFFGPDHQTETEPEGRFLIQLIDSLEFAPPAPTPSETGAQHRHYWGGPYGMDNVRVEEPPPPTGHETSADDVPGRPLQITIRETGEWLVESANFGQGTAYVYLATDGKSAFYFSET